MRNFLRLVSCAVFVLAVAAAPAQALPITDGGLTLDTATGANIIGQTDINPCVIGPPNCNNPAGFDLTKAGSGGAGSIFDRTSPLYTFTQIADVVGGNSFSMLLDYNQTVHAQTLYLFEAIYFGAAGEISRQTFAAPTVLQTINNGAGFSDFIITGFVMPAGTTGVQFHANWFNNDGADRYFLKGAQAAPCDPNVPGDCPESVPEPSLLALLGLGMVGAGAVRRRFRG